MSDAQTYRIDVSRHSFGKTKHLKTLCKRDGVPWEGTRLEAETEVKRISKLDGSLWKSIYLILPSNFEGGMLLESDQKINNFAAHY